MYSFQMWLAFLSHMIIKQSTNTYFVLFRTHFLLMLLTLNCFPAFLLRNCDISNLGCNHNTQRPWPRSAWVSSWCRWKRSLYINGRSHWPWLASTADYSHGNYQRVVSFFKRSVLSVCLIDIRVKLDCGPVFWKKGCLEVCIMHFIIVNLSINSTSTTNMVDDITTTTTITERFVA